MNIWISAKITNAKDGSVRHWHNNLWCNVKDDAGAALAGIIAKAGADCAQFANPNGDIDVVLKSSWGGQAQPDVVAKTDDAGVYASEGVMLQALTDMRELGKP